VYKVTDFAVRFHQGMIELGFQEMMMMVVVVVEKNDGSI
jgi:hypothetical protein